MDKHNKYNWISVLKQIKRGSPVSGCFYVIGQYIRLVTKDLTYDKILDTLSRTINQETKQTRFY